MLRFPVLLLFAVVAFGYPAMARDAAPFALYSDVCVHVETGDLLGTRMAFISLSDATYVFFQSAEGSLEPPQIAKLPPGDLKRGNFNFAIMIAGKSKTLRGIVSKDSITASFDDHSLGPFGKTEFHLKKINSPLATMPECQ